MALVRRDFAKGISCHQIVGNVCQINGQNVTLRGNAMRINTTTLVQFGETCVL